MKTNENIMQLRPRLLLLSIIFIVACFHVMVLVSNGITGSRIKKERDSTSPVDIITSSDIEKLPANQRSFEDLMRLTPGIVTQNQDKDTSRIFIRGLPSDIDGVKPASAETLSYEGFNTGFKERYDQGLTYSVSFTGWNDTLHRDRLRLNDTPLQNSTLTLETVRQPEYAIGLPAMFLEYKPFGELSFGSFGLDYQFADSAGQPTYGTPYQSSPSFQGAAEISGLISSGLYLGKSSHEIGQKAYQKSNNIVTASEAIASSYIAYDMTYWEGEPPSAGELDQIIGAALWDTWLLVMGNAGDLTARDAATAMATTVLAMSGDVSKAYEVAMMTLEMFGNATEEDRTLIGGALGFFALGQMMSHGGPIGSDFGQFNLENLYKPEKWNGTIDYLGYRLDPVFVYKDQQRLFMGTVEPNDPLYKKEGNKKVASGIRKGLSFLLGAVNAPVDVDDTLSDDQWGLHEVGFKPRGTSGSAWDVIDGSQKNVLVAVIDSGLDTAHPDGPQYLWTNADEVPGNGVDDDANGYVDDVHGWNFVGENNDIRDDFGHGTFVTGIIAAKRNNGAGIAGINPGARIMTLKILGKKGTSKTLAVYRAIRYAVDNGARVLNLSIGGRGLSPLEQIGINYAYTMGCIVVVAAGNQGSNIAEYGPPGARRSFSVAAMDLDNSPRGTSNKGLNVALAAPGESVYSLTAEFKGKRDVRLIPLLAKDYHRLDGTSFAAPFVAATASLIWTREPELDQRQVEDMILQSAQDIYTKGWDMPTGMGKLDAYAAFSQDPDKLLAPRITEVFVNKVKRKIASVDIYGVVRGNLESYRVEVGHGKNPKKWQQVFGPTTSVVEHDLICRIDGQVFAKGSKWKVRLIAMDKQGQSKIQEILVSKK